MPPDNSNFIVSERAVSLALMLAEVHLGDNDCLGIAARVLYAELNNKVELPKDLDC